MKIPVLNIDGKQTGEYELSLSFSKEDYKFEHIAYLLKRQQDAALRQGSHSTKTRGEVAGGGAKPYKQKGTGKARRGSNRTPLRVGGGVTFGPKPRSYSFSLNRKVIKLGYRLATQALGSRIRVLDESTVLQAKTSQFSSFIRTVDDTASKVLLVISEESNDSNLIKSARNIKGVTCVQSTWIPIELYSGSELIVFTNNSFKELEERFLK
jgi:large subunit ribosomal protein L4